MRAIITFFLSTASVLAFSAQTVSVNVNIDGLPFRVVSTPSGINCPDSCEAKFHQNDTVVLTAVPDFFMEKPDLFYVAWDGSCNDPSATCTINEQGNFSVSAEIPIGVIASLLRYPSPVLDPTHPDWPIPRYDENGYGYGVVDNLTGIQWMQDANCMQTHYSWLDNGWDGIDEPADGLVDRPTAEEFIAGINSGMYNACITNDPDYYQDACIDQGGVWAFPTKDELESLVDERFGPPRISNSIGDGQATDGDPFFNLSNDHYWSSTEYVREQPSDPNSVWVVSVGEGTVGQAGIFTGDGFHPIWLVCRPPAN